MRNNRSWLLAGLGGVVGVLLVAIFLLAGQLRVRYEALLVQQVWPARLVRPPVVTQATQNQGAVLMAGDSRIAEWDGITLSNRTLVNAGQPGATTAQLRLQMPDLLNAFRPAVVVIQAGVNDLKLVGLKPELAPAIVAQAADNLSNVVAQCSQCGCRVILLEVWPVCKPEWLRRPVWDKEIAVAVTHLNDRLRGLDVPSNNVCVFDVLKPAGLAEDKKKFRDALHFQPAVYQALTPVLQKKIAGFSAE